METNDIMLPPHDADSERAVLGSLLLMPSAIDEISAILTEEHFYVNSHRLIFRAIMSLYERRVPAIDPVILGDELVRQRTYEEIGGALYLMQILETVPHAAHVRFYATIVAKNAIRRTVIYSAREAIRKAHDKSYDPEDVANETISTIETMIGNTSEEVRSFADVVTSYRIRMTNPLPPQSTGIKDVDDRLRGFRDAVGGLKPTQLITLGARPAMGKSAYVSGLIEAASDTDITSLLFPLEMDGEDIAERIDRVDDNRLEELAQRQNIFIEDRRFELDSVISTIRQSHKRKRVRFVVIDYLGLVEVDGSLKDNEKVSRITRRLKMLAKELRIPIVLAAQLNRDLEKRENKRPQLSDIRGSGCLSGDTIIYGENGPIRMSDMCSHATSRSVFALHDDGKMRETSSRKTWYTGCKDTKTITLTTGHQIKATLNHKFNSDGVWKPLETLRVGDVIAVPLNCCSAGEPTITLAEARLLGLFISNGCTLPRKTIQITLNSKDTDIADRIVEDLHETFPSELRPYAKHESHKSRPGSAWIQVYAPSIRVPSKKKRSVLVSWLIKHGLYGKKASQKTIPNVMFSQPREIVSEFLRALFAGDGTTQVHECKTKKGKHQYNVASYSSASRSLIDGVQWLLQCTGVLSGISTVHSRGFKSHILQVYSRTFKNKFASEIGYLGKRKQHSMLNVIERMNNAQLGWEKYKADGDVVFVPIRKIEDAGYMDVYDIEVPGPANFVANGIIAHNSIEQDSDVVMFLYRHEVYYPNEKPGVAEVIIAKQRNGPVGAVEVGFVKEKTRFVDRQLIAVDIDGFKFSN